MSEVGPVAGDPAVDGAAPVVTLHGGDLPWRTVSPALRTVRLVVVALCTVPALVAAAVAAVVLTPWAWLAALAVVGGAFWSTWVVSRQVSAITWVELPDEIVVRKGRLWRELVSIPYGRLQYVDIHSGPLMRSRGIATCEFHTASPESGGTLPGLTTPEAEALRARLAARGAAQQAGL
jgi:membrane protein YdbS with pleckstrin-like domain